jgi:hypothetical protein
MRKLRVTRKLRGVASRKSRAPHAPHAPHVNYMTIPQIKTAFDYISQYIMSEKPSVAEFKKEWKKVFHREMDDDNAKSYIEFVMKKPVAGRKLRKFRGGAEPGLVTGQGLVAGAVTDSGLRPYGVFPEYVASGFEVGIPEMSSKELCGNVLGQQGPIPTAPSGGKRTLRRVRGGRFPFSTAPPSFTQNILTSFRGQELPASGSPIENPYIRAATVPF